MPTKPTVSTEWATQDVSNGVNNTDNKIAPTSNHKDFGLTFPDTPSRNHYNYILNANYQWQQWAENTLDGRSDHFEINLATSNYPAGTIVIGSGTVMTTLTSTAYNHVDIPGQTFVFTGSNNTTIFADVNSGNMVALDGQDIVYDERVPLYHISMSAGTITAVKNLQNAPRADVDRGGIVRFDPQANAVGYISGDYTNPSLHTSNQPGFFLGHYGGTGVNSQQGFSVVNSTTDYLHYYEGNLEVGPGTTVTGFPSGNEYNNTTKYHKTDFGNYDDFAVYSNTEVSDGGVGTVQVTQYHPAIFGNGRNQVYVYRDARDLAGAGADNTVEATVVNKSNDLDVEFGEPLQRALFSPTANLTHSDGVSLLGRQASLFRPFTWDKPTRFKIQVTFNMDQDSDQTTFVGFGGGYVWQESTTSGDWRSVGKVIGSDAGTADGTTLGLLHDRNNNQVHIIAASAGTGAERHIHSVGGTNAWLNAPTTGLLTLNLEIQYTPNQGIVFIFNGDGSVKDPLYVPAVTPQAGEGALGSDGTGEYTYWINESIYPGELANIVQFPTLEMPDIVVVKATAIPSGASFVGTGIGLGVAEAWQGE